MSGLNIEAYLIVRQALVCQGQLCVLWLAAALQSLRQKSTDSESTHRSWKTKAPFTPFSKIIPLSHLFLLLIEHPNPFRLPPTQTALQIPDHFLVHLFMSLLIQKYIEHMFINMLQGLIWKQKGIWVLVSIWQTHQADYKKEKERKILQYMEEFIQL